MRLHNRLGRPQRALLTLTLTDHADRDDASIAHTTPLDEPPAWLRFLALASAAAVLTFGGIGLLLAINSWYTPTLAFALGAIASVLVVWLGREALASMPSTQRDTRHRRRRAVRHHRARRMEHRAFVAARAHQPRRRVVSQYRPLDRPRRLTGSEHSRRAVRTRRRPCVRLLCRLRDAARQGGVSVRASLAGAARGGAGGRWRPRSRPRATSHRRHRTARFLRARLAAATRSLVRTRGDAGTRIHHSAGVVHARRLFGNADTSPVVHGCLASRDATCASTLARRVRRRLVPRHAAGRADRRNRHLHRCATPFGVRVDTSLRARERRAATRDRCGNRRVRPRARAGRGAGLRRSRTPQRQLLERPLAQSAEGSVARLRIRDRLCGRRNRLAAPALDRPPGAVARLRERRRGVRRPRRLRDVVRAAAHTAHARELERSDRGAAGTRGCRGRHRRVDTSSSR